MSLISTLGTKFAAGVIGIAALASGATALAATNPTIQNDFKAVQAAISAKDLNAYKSAESQLITDQSKARTDKVNATTQEQLNSMADRQVKQKAVQDAIKNNDYNAFKANADSRMLAKTPDQASFDKLVASHKVRAETMAKLDAAVIANDSGTYIQVVKDAQSKRITNQASDNGHNQNHPRKLQTDAQIQANFDQAHTAYVADNSVLPSTQSMKGFGRGHKGFNNPEVSGQADEKGSIDSNNAN